MLLAQVRSGEDPNAVVAVLERIGVEPDREVPAPGRRRKAPHADGRSTVVAEERLPIVEEELRVGTNEVVRGGARVRARVEELPVIHDVELLEEFLRIDKRPVNRRVSDRELEEAGLLRERVVEVAQIREEAVVSKEAFVREEVVISKTIEHRVEQIHDTLRRTEVNSKDLAVGAAREREV
jgi:stress response protein YsnF